MTSGDGYKDRAPLEAQKGHTEKVSDNLNFFISAFHVGTGIT